MTDRSSNMEEFGHDPSSIDAMDSTALQDFDTIHDQVEQGDSAGMGIVLTRHDPLLVVELAGVIDATNDIYTKAATVLDALGPTWTERDEVDRDVIRSFYFGSLPDNLHGGDPVVFAVSDDRCPYSIRLYDRGWAPVFGARIFESAEDIANINESALERLLATAGIDWGDSL